MKILYLTQVLPYPPDSGGKIKTWETLKVLSKKHQIWLVCFAPISPSTFIKRQLEQVCFRVKVIVSPFPTAEFREMKSFIFKSLFSPLPFIVFRHRDKKMNGLVNKLIDEEKFDVLHIDHLNMASYLPKKKDCLWVLEEHNLESEINWGIAWQEKWNKFKIFSLLEVLKLTIYERTIIHKFDYIFAISEEDREKLIRLGVKKEKVFFLPTPIKIEPLFSFNNYRLNILFVGVLSWWPNKDAFFWFYKKIFPKVKKEFPDIRFIVVGKEAPEKMVGLDERDSYLELVGYVKDLEKYLAKASVFIVPLRVGSGIRIKILTALSTGIPVVSTTKGAEGIVKKTGNGIILVDKPENFARAVIKVLKDKNLADNLSRAGLDFIKKKYNQFEAEKALNKTYRAINN